VVNIKGITMKQWLELIKTKNDQSVIFDAESLAAASQTIIDRHGDLKHCEANILSEAEAVDVLLEGGSFAVNKI
jgi:hypothetical protein